MKKSRNLTGSFLILYSVIFRGIKVYEESITSRVVIEKFSVGDGEFGVSGGNLSYENACPALLGSKCIGAGEHLCTQSLTIFGIEGERELKCVIG